MKNNFIKTKNVKRFISLMDNLQKAPANISKMALVYGPCGLGKSQTIMWWVTNNDAIYVRCTHRITPRWLLSEILQELNEEPCYLTQMMFEQLEKKLKYSHKIIVVDEIDYLFSDKHTIETLRDIHDKFGVPILLVGMELANRKLMKYAHINDRIYAKLKFEKFENSDYKEIIENLSEFEFTPDAIKTIIRQNLQFRQLTKIINKIEIIANTNKLEKITNDIVLEVINER